VLARVLRVEQRPNDVVLRGARIDMPVEGLVAEDRGVDVWGWVVGRNLQPIHVVFLAENRAPVRVKTNQARPEIGARFPDSAAAATSGFRGTADVDRDGVRATLVVAAVWPDGARTAFGAIHVERFWRVDTDPAVGALVSVVVLAPEADEEPISRSLASAHAQSYVPREVVVVAPTKPALRESARFVPLEGFTMGDAYATGMRKTDGDLLVFLEAGSRLRDDVLVHGVAKLRAAPAVAAVLDLGDDGAVIRTPALYRRSALRACGPIERRVERPEPWLLARLQAVTGEEATAAVPVRDRLP
jgi:hypothetical protein